MRGCRDVAFLIASDGLGNAGWWTRLRVGIHRLYCKACRRYAADLNTIATVSRDTWNVASVDEATVRRLEGAILAEAFGEGPSPPL